MTRDTTQETIEQMVESLIEEIGRYLAAVDVFRAEGAGPTWLDDEALPDWWLEEMCATREPASADALS